MSTVQDIANVIGLKFSSDDVRDANKVWGCNCGPTALAVVAGISLEDIRPHLGKFDSMRYMSPTMMSDAINSIGLRWSESPLSRGTPSVFAPGCFPPHGLVRIQWTGPWTQPGANPKWAYRQTHWIATLTVDGEPLVFDVNNGPSRYQQWASEVPPLITKDINRADGGWTFSHLWEVAIP